MAKQKAKRSWDRAIFIRTTANPVAGTIMQQFDAYCNAHNYSYSSVALVAIQEYLKKRGAG